MLVILVIQVGITTIPFCFVMFDGKHKSTYIQMLGLLKKEIGDSIERTMILDLEIGVSTMNLLCNS